MEKFDPEILVKYLHLKCMRNKYLITVIGPTAIGKTELAIRLGEHFKTEIISSDSRQFYKEMSIGTAVPSEEELRRVKHHFIQSRSIHEDYNVGAFEKDALDLISMRFNELDLLIMVGGSGLYVDAVTRGLDEFPDVDPSVRAQLLKELEQGGLTPLQERLKTLDPLSYERMDIQNKQRVIRALEICQGTGKAFSSYLKNSAKSRDFKTLKIGLRADREIVYDRINKRVDQMMEAGLLNEVRQLQKNSSLNALQTVGYKELFNYLEAEDSDENLTLDQAVSEIKKNTRRFAKRQETWFKKDKEIVWFDYDAEIELIIDFIESRIKFK